MRSSSYLCDKISNERDIRVELLQTPANVTNYGQDVAAAQEMNHSVQESLLQLQLSGGKYNQAHSQLQQSNTERSSASVTHTCSMTSSWECSVSNSLMSSWRTCGCSSWWHVQICVAEVFTFKLGALKGWKWNASAGCDVVPRPVKLNAPVCGPSAAGSSAAQTLSSPPILKPP